MKRVFLIILCLLLAALSVYLNAEAATTDLSNVEKTVVTYGDWILERIDDGKYWELDEYIGEGTEIITPRFINNILVTAYGDYCCANNTTIKSVVTSSPLWTIGDYVFLNCTALESFECNYALRTIGISAFSGTTSLKNINLQDSVVTAISPYCFASSGIESVKLPDSCTKIGIYAFSYCLSLSKIVVPNSVTEIADNAFEGCDDLVIYCKTDSYAHEYAEANGIDYVLIDAPYEVTFMLGDADGDGAITIMDATKVQRLLAELIEDPDGMIALRGDCNEGGLDILDATKVQRWLADLEVAESIGEYTTVTITPTV